MNHCVTIVVLITWQKERNIQINTQLVQLSSINDPSILKYNMFNKAIEPLLNAVDE